MTSPPSRSPARRILLPLGHRHRVLPGRGRRHRGRPGALDLGHLHRAPRGGRATAATARWPATPTSGSTRTSSWSPGWASTHYRFSLAWPRIVPDGLRRGRAARAGLLRPAGRRAAGARHHPDGDALPLGPAAGPGGRGRLAEPRHRRALRRLRRDRARAPRRPGRTCGRPTTSRGARRTSATAPASRARAPGGRPRARRGPPPAARPRPGRGAAARGRGRRGRHRAQPHAGVARAPRGRRRPPTASTRSATGSGSTRWWTARTTRRAAGRARCSPTPRSSATATSTWSAARPTGSGVNYYTPARVDVARRHGGASYDGPATPGRAFPGVEDLRFTPRGPLTDIGWEIEPRGLEELLVATHRRTGLPAGRHRERRGLRRHRRATDGGGSTTRTGSPTCATTSPPSSGPASRAPTSAATSAGRCWTTSSGPRATPRPSGWSRSTAATQDRTPKALLPLVRRAASPRSADRPRR